MESYEAAMDYQLKAMGLEENMPFEEQVVETVQYVLGFQCGRLYCRQYFPEETIGEVEEIVKLVTEAFGKRISELDWMSEETKAEAEKKLETMTVRIGYPDNWPQDRYELMLAGILMPPFYDPEAFEEENLGSIGTVIAHEITHAVDHGRGFLPYYNEPEGSADPSGLKSIIYA